MRPAALLGVLCGGCVASGSGGVTVPLLVAGTPVDAPIVVGDAEITLSRAELAFGPLYLCGGAQAGDLCDTARLEWLDAAVVDALDPDAVEVGELTGVTGHVRSWMYDVGYSSLLTDEDPLALPATDALGGASVRLEGMIAIEGAATPFSAAVSIRAQEATERGVPLVRSSSGEGLDHDVQAGEPGLLVTFDPAPWVTEIDPSMLVGGASAIAIDGDGQAARAIRNQIVAGPRPQFQWGIAP